MNVGVMFVPQQEAWIVERMGKWVCLELTIYLFFSRYNKILEPGLNFLIPIFDKVLLFALLLLLILTLFLFLLLL